ncbi:hypothetical protein EG835_10710 [bacterium]|nr:hypothetical protein [bacterium]
MIPSLVDAGLAGLEAFHADHSPRQRDHYSQLAADLGLLATGGSDFHGGGVPGPGIGDVDIADDVLTQLLDAAGWSDRLA